MKRSRACLASSALLASALALGAPREVFLGQTFAIAEPDTLAEIKTAARSRDWASWMRRKPKDYSAFSSATLPRVKGSSSRLFDPTYTLPWDVQDDKGKLLFAKGTRVNVYERLKLKVSHRFIVIGDTPADYRWLDEVAKPVTGDKVLLANGNVLESRTRTGRTLFILDERFVERFGVRAVPSIIAQEGTQLRVTEYALAQ